MPSRLCVKHVKKSHTIAYPRRDEADSYYPGRGPTVISAPSPSSLCGPPWHSKLMSRTQEATLYVDKTAPNSHYYTRAAG